MSYICVLPPDLICVGEIDTLKAQEQYQQYGKHCKNVVVKESADLVDLEKKVQNNIHAFFACTKGTKGTKEPPKKKVRKNESNGPFLTDFEGLKKVLATYIQNKAQVEFLYAYMRVDTLSVAPNEIKDFENAQCAVFSKDGKYVAYARDLDRDLDQRHVMVWKIEEKRLIQSFRSRLTLITCIDLSPNNKVLLCGGWASENDRMISMCETWDLDSKESKVWTSLDEVELNGGLVNAVSFSQDGSHFVSGSEYSLKNWDFSREEKVVLLNSDEPSQSVAFSPDGADLASASKNRIDIYNVKPQKPVQDKKMSLLILGEEDIVSVVYNSRGTQIASGNQNGYIRIWEVGTKQLRHTLVEHQDSVSCILFSPDGSKLISGSDDRSLKIWDVASGELIKTLGRHPEKILNMWISADAKRLMTISADYLLKNWDL